MKTVYDVIHDELFDWGVPNAMEVAEAIIEKFGVERETQFGRLSGETIWWDYAGSLQMFPESRTYTRETLTITTGWEEKE